MSCYAPHIVKTVVVAEKITRNGTYQVVCSDGLDSYVIYPYSRIALGTRVDMDKRSHTFRIVWDMNGKTSIGMGSR